MIDLLAFIAPAGRYAIPFNHPAGALRDELS
jgi:hypothetical protein